MTDVVIDIRWQSSIDGLSDALVLLAGSVATPIVPPGQALAGKSRGVFLEVQYPTRMPLMIESLRAGQSHLNAVCALPVMLPVGTSLQSGFYAALAHPRLGTEPLALMRLEAHRLWLRFPLGIPWFAPPGGLCDPATPVTLYEEATHRSLTNLDFCPAKITKDGVTGT